MSYVYILWSSKDKKFYIGSTTDLKRRYIEHNKGLVPSTSHRIPLRLLYYEAYLGEKDARLREKQLKSRGNARRQLFGRLNTSLSLLPVECLDTQL